ncbi:MAG TPA: dTDP-4-dehydrorhamnose 3,5-epimerase [Flavisolibacter sp.]|jgi:dTDP-4-dehydrorhamnose 3,5-epimerase|nr:dTDP-4-dehydrorhamnose 3,5-epimerase [Flavisolibacter sp.]
MKYYTTDIPDLIVFEPKVLNDSRGYFFESYNKKMMTEAGLNVEFVQDNQSKSSYGVIRGLHYQLNPNAQSKLVRVLFGSILDVAVDIRIGSPTFGKSFSLELSSENKKQLYIPTGFAHGFSVLTETAIVMYKCDGFYNRESEAGIKYNDPALEIDWQIPSSKEIISEKDQSLPSLAECRNNFQY